MNWGVVMSMAMLVPLVYFARKTNGPLSWVLWGIALVPALSLIIYIWINLIWHFVLLVLRDFF